MASRAPWSSSSYDRRLVWELADYLDLNIDQARAQWQSILHRPPRPPGQGFRQVPFVPVETLLCLAAMLVVDHHHYGGSTASSTPSPVPELAALFRRTPESVLAKQANLDYSRSHGGRHDREVGARMFGDAHLLSATYRVGIEAARAEGIGPEMLPDFLGLGTEVVFAFLGQDELMIDDLETEAERRLRGLAAGRSPIDQFTERLLLASIRVGQHRFASRVLANFGHSCGFCGMHPGRGLERRGLLVASHIKPWRQSDDRERLDPANGIAACPTHDAAFDSGLLWVNGGYRIHLTPRLAEASRADAALSASLGQPPIADRLIVPPGSTAPDARYLAWHRENVAAA
jgi:putative restriction endonuclease